MDERTALPHDAAVGRAPEAEADGSPSEAEADGLSPSGPGTAGSAHGARPSADGAVDGGSSEGGDAVEDVTSTGDDAVDEALTLLARLDTQPLRAHVAAFDAVHGALQDRLADAEG